METFTDEQLISIINQLKTAVNLIPVEQRDISVLRILEVLATEHLLLRKKFNVLENSFIQLYAEKREVKS